MVVFLIVLAVLLAIAFGAWVDGRAGRMLRRGRKEADRASYDPSLNKRMNYERIRTELRNNGRGTAR